MTFKEKFEQAVHEYIEETNCPMPFVDVERALCAGIIAQIDRENPGPDEEGEK